MKKQGFILILFVLMNTISFSQHRPDHPEQGKPNPKEHLEHVKKDIIRPLQLTAEKEKKVTEIFQDFLSEMDKKHDAGKHPSKEEMDKLVNKRDEALKKILTDEEFKKLKELEKKNRPNEGHPRP